MEGLYYQMGKKPQMQIPAKKWVSLDTHVHKVIPPLTYCHWSIFALHKVLEAIRTKVDEGLESGDDSAHPILQDILALLEDAAEM